MRPRAFDPVRLSDIPLSHHATRLSFFLAGFVMAVWAALVPFAKSRLGMDEGSFGLLLLCVGLGALVTMPFFGILVARAGCRPILAVALPAALFLPAAVSLMSSSWAAAALLVLFGAAFGAVDVSMNVHSVAVEKAAGRKLLSGFHALYSVGGVAGALLMTALLNISLPPWLAALLLAATASLIWLAAGRWVLPDAGKSEHSAKQRFVFPKGAILVIGLLAGVMFLVEGSILDWGAVFLSEAKGADMENASLGFAAFSAAMTLMRLVGDRLIMRLGAKRTTCWGALIAAAAIVAAVLVPSPGAAMAAFFIVGAGVANIVPILFASSGEQDEMPMSLALASITTLGYAGLLAGPAVIGAVAHAASLPAALIGEALLLVAAAAAASRVIHR